ncbi:glycosyl hydrolase family 18 protein [Synechococcus sp. UW179A]|uniref:glycosyl hydrolase family 18 protein n=1 Tax=Synechococcus sp. UW179A TaxID=2575510 RepID=UPI000E0F0147|nr:glycosyl hydrolase family 18 protein [Synechococcus sp. UW179A]
MATFVVGDFSQDIRGFDPAADNLDFGNVSVHSLILGQDENGFATIVFPWQPDQFQRILDTDGLGVRWSDLSADNFAPVANEHLRQDIGAVLSWENQTGPAFNDGDPGSQNTVYIRSHEKDSITRIDNFDPLTDKINFLYFGTRERLEVENVGADLVISSEPNGQKFVFTGIQKEDLIGANLEFHFDQIEEDLLDRAFGFSPEQLALADRTNLFTPEGGYTDGAQARPGQFVTAVGEAPGQPTSLDESKRLIQERADQTESDSMIPASQLATSEMAGMPMQMPMEMEMTPPDLSTAVMNLSGGSNVHNSCLQLEVDGSLWWGGGISGNLIIHNPMGVAVEDWQASFLTPHGGFESWSGEVSVADAGNGLNRVTFKPASWNRSIAANGEISISFNAQGEGLADSGALTNAEFFAGAGEPVSMQVPEAVAPTTISPDPQPLADQQSSPSEGFGQAAMSPVLADALTAVDIADQPVDQAPEEGPVDSGSMVTNSSVNPLSIEASGSLYWGGMSGILSITNSSERAIDNWSVSFETPHSNFQSWAGSANLEALPGGGSKVTLTPATWNSTIAAGQTIDVSFNAVSEGIPNSGELTSALFFSQGNGSESASIDSELSVDVVSTGGLADTTAPAQSQPVTTLAASADRLPAEPDDSELPSQPAELLGPVEPLSGPDRVVIAPEIVAASGQAISGSDKKLVAYFEEWGIYERDFLVQDIKVDELTHINYSFFDVKSNGDVKLFDAWAATDKRFLAAEQVNRTFTRADWLELDAERLKTYTTGADFTATTNADGSVTVTGVPMDWNTPVDYVGNLRQFDLLKQLHPEVNLGFALGGWTLSDEFSLAVDSVADREAFTDNIVDIFQQYDFFNTVDFDWEYPGGGGESGNASSPEDGDNFALTLELLRGKLDQLAQVTGEDYEVSIATAGGYEKLSNLNLPGIDPYVDFYNVMTYDFHGGWESQTGHQAAMINDPGGYDVVTAIEQFQANDVDLSKVILGAPAYTRAWGGVDAGETLGLGNNGDSRQAPGSFEAGNYDQKDLITGISDGSYELIWDDDSKAAFAYSDATRVWSSVETPATIAGKTAFIDDMGLGGMMFWALSNDSSGDQSLITAASELLRGSATFDEVISRSEQFDFILGGDGQFGPEDFTQLNQGSVGMGGIPSDVDLLSTALPADGRNDGSTLVDSAPMF